MDQTTRNLLVHFLAALAYRTQKALRDAPPGFAEFSAGAGVRTPIELVRHMNSVLGYARTFFIGGVYWPDPLDSFQAEVDRFHQTVAELGYHLRNGTELTQITPLQLLQGPFSDAMTHAGQLAMLRRLAESPVESENFIFAGVSADNLGADQPPPAAPTPKWTGSLVQLLWKLTARRRS
jgi:hypothetical protein